MSEADTIDQLMKVLQELPDVHAPVLKMQKDYGHGDFDAEIVVDVGKKHLVLLIEVKKSVYPRDAQQVLWKLSHYLANVETYDRNTTIVPFLAAESISQGAKDLLKKERFGYFDTGGSLFIPARGAYIYVEKPPPKTLEKSVGGLFKGKRAQVLYTLLNCHEEWFSVKALSERANVSSGTASETLSALERFEWVSVRGQGPSKERKLTQASELLDEWKNRSIASPRQQSYRRYYVPGAGTEELTQRLAHVCEMLRVEYVLTQEVAAQFYEPFLSTISRVTCRMAPGSQTAQAVSELGARAVAEGANLNVIETKSHGEFLFKELKNSVWLASPVQVYLDLMRGGGRAKEMAEHLRHERIGF